jgi:hypothetical protein
MMTTTSMAAIMPKPTSCEALNLRLRFGFSCRFPIRYPP